MCTTAITSGKCSTFIKRNPTARRRCCSSSTAAAGSRATRKGVNVKPYLDAGISVVSINYRYSWQAQLAGVKPPVKAPLEDAARALQFVRSKAAEWNIDKQRIGASGGSAGALLVAVAGLPRRHGRPEKRRPDRARIHAPVVAPPWWAPQTSLDPQELKEWTPNSRYGGHAFGFMDPNDLKTRDTRFAEFLEHREEVLPWIKEYSPIELVTADDPPVYLIYSSAAGARPGTEGPDAHGELRREAAGKMHQRGRGLRAGLSRAPDVKHKSIDDYLIASLKARPVDTKEAMHFSHVNVGSILRAPAHECKFRPPRLGESGLECFVQQNDCLQAGRASKYESGRLRGADDQAQPKRMGIAVVGTANQRRYGREK